MSEEKKPEARTTSADIKKQIEQAKQELKESGLPLIAGIANDINASESTPQVPAKAEIKPDPENPAAKSVESANPQNNVDLKEWAKKRGIDWTTEESVLSALRKSDQQFHQKRAEERIKEGERPQYVPPQPQYIPQAPNPVYAPPPVNNRALLENLAVQYRMPVEDVERLMAFNRDFFQAASREDRERNEKKMAQIERENQKNSVFRELSSDPVFRKPEVAIEFHRVLDEMQSRDPQSFEQDPNAYMRAYDRTLQNIARRNLEGQPLQEGTPPIARLPTNPPRPLGQGSGGGSMENEMQIDPQQFAKLPLAEKAKYLEARGLRPAY